MKYLRLLCIILISFELFISSNQNLSFLEDADSDKIEMKDELKFLKYSPIPKITLIDPLIKNDKEYELTTYLDEREEETYLVIKINEKTRDDEYFMFEGDYHFLTTYDNNWKIFKDIDSIFNNFIKKMVIKKSFRINFENIEKQITIEFDTSILDEYYLLRILLNKQTKIPVNPKNKPDLKSLNLEISNLKRQVDYLESYQRNFRKIQELVAYIPSGPNSYPNSLTETFELNIYRSGEIEFHVEFEIYNTRSSDKLGFYAAIQLKIQGNEYITIPLFNTNITSQLPQIYKMEYFRSSSLIKGKYSGSLNYSNSCQLLSLNIRAIHK